MNENNVLNKTKKGLVNEILIKGRVYGINVDSFVRFHLIRFLTNRKKQNFAAVKMTSAISFFLFI